MPKVRMGNMGEFWNIPFDADVIADLMHRGYTVFPDDGINADLYREQDNLVRNAINIRIAREQWGDQKLAPELKRFKLKAPPSLNEDDRFSKRIQPPGTVNEGDFLNIKPNPFMTNMPEIDPGGLMSPPWDKKTWEL